MARMLIVDDEPDICECLGEYFKDKGFDVAYALNGEVALEHLVDHAPDVILLDIRLPGCSGIDVLRRAKDLHPESKVIMVTSLDQSDLRVEAKAYGACGYVTKPFDFSEATWAPVFAA